MDQVVIDPPGNKEADILQGIQGNPNLLPEMVRALGGQPRAFPDRLQLHRERLPVAGEIAVQPSRQPAGQGEALLPRRKREG